MKTQSSVETKTEKLRMNQEQAYKYWEEKNMRMLNTDDLEKAIKDKDLLKELQEEMNEHWLLTGTRITYETDSLNATIMPHKGKAIKIKVPIVWGQFDKSDKEQVAYLTALFGKNFDKVIKTLNRDNKPIWLYTPDQASRKAYPIRAVGLCFSGCRFDVVGNGWFDNYYGGGCSHGVLSNSEPKARSKSK